MLSAMAVTLLLVQTGSGGAGAVQGGREGTVDVPGPPDGRLRIMVVGDSLTQGSSGDYTWRYRLWRHLGESGVDADFVGPYDGVYGLTEGGSDHAYADPDFDTDHAARWGTTARDLADDVARVAAEHEPQYLLLLAGVEDILAGGGADHALAGVGETVSTVRVALSGVRFVIGELPAVEGTGDDARINAEIRRFNMGVVDLAQRLTSQTSPVVVARVAADYVPSRDSWDEVHPNARGELRIAAAFADALAEPLGVGRGFPRPLPTVATGPRTAPEPAVEESADGLVLSWDAVPGATDYRVVQRRLGPDPDEAVVLPAEVSADGDRRSVLVGALLSGARYEFVVRQYKGRDEGERSEPLSLVWNPEPPPAPAGVRVVDDGATVVWEAVGEATHYEVWLRALACSPSDDSRAPADARDGEPSTDPGHGEDEPRRSPDDDPPPGGPDPEPDATPTPAPSPQPSPRPTPGPTTPPPPRGTECAPVDDRGPDDGEGWHSQGPTGPEPRWTATVSGPYEAVVRAHRDYVEGGYSAPVLLGDG
ncbi:GDSL-type esterase/lipase family protein [Nocardiopsis sp. FIRDI 009]|uniref:GDSL-type esterase/lipase family protein n=1 Tax=Nocardiopsis sp. FIRDI 009 TaxID=714197 RepID=UPI0018E5282B|nr:GDSL-type esterase/lipase family protein [Nocardiopsis sp. FIRDI 009]